MLKKILQLGKKVASSTKVKPAALQDYLQLGLLGKNIELLNAVVALSENELFGSLPILIRSMIEGYVDLKMSQKDEHYLKHLTAKNCENALKAVVYLEKHPESEILNLMFPKQEDIQKVRDEYSFVKQKLSEYKVKRYKISEAFHAIGDGDFYYSIYSYLCRYTHNNPDQIAKNYFITENGEPKTVKVYKPYSESELKILDMLAGRIFYRILLDFSEYFKIECAAELVEIDHLISERSNAHGT